MSYAALFVTRRDETGERGSPQKVNRKSVYNREYSLNWTELNALGPNYLQLPKSLDALLSATVSFSTGMLLLGQKWRLSESQEDDDISKDDDFPLPPSLKKR